MEDEAGCSALKEVEVTMTSVFHRRSESYVTGDKEKTHTSDSMKGRGGRR